MRIHSSAAAATAICWSALLSFGFTRSGWSEETAANRVAPVFQRAPAVPSTTFSAHPTAGEIGRTHLFEEALVPMGAAALDAAENFALAGALTVYGRDTLARGAQVATADLAPLEKFLSTHPQSAWRASLLTNLGLEYYRRGLFTKALDAWRQAWQTGQTETAPRAVAVVDRALAELVRMEARLGRVAGLQTLFDQTAKRQLQGTPARIYDDARGGLTNMLKHPGESFKCGPWALDSILAASDPKDPLYGKIHDYASTDHGTSLSMVAALAREMKMDLQPAHREGAGAVPVPAVVHWKLGHYGALLKMENGRYLLKDPTFGTTQWISQAALDQEASGYFLIGGQSLPAGWRTVPDAEAQGVWGKGYPSGFPFGACGPADPSKPKKKMPQKPPGNPPPNKCPNKGKGKGKGMADWTIHLSVLSLSIFDTPLGYEPPVGPPVYFNVNYDQREDNQPSTLSFSNLGQGWNFDWITTLTFDSNNAYVNNGAGGSSTFPNFTAATQYSYPSEMAHTHLFRAPNNVFQEIYPDGAMSVFGLADASGRYYLTAVADPHGNQVQLGYDSQYRLITITDAIGQVSTLTYGLAADPLKITKITDPFGRTALFDYNASNQLVKITDAVGMTSQFTYGTGSFIHFLTTDYGTTTFDTSVSQFPNSDRTLTVTLPDGSKEMAQSIGGPAATSDTNNFGQALVVPSGISLSNYYLDARNTFYWDRKAMHEAPGDLRKAEVFHFSHAGGLKGRVLESTVKPLENRIWYFHQNQTNPLFDNVGEMDNDTAAARVLDDGSTQLYLFGYNEQGNPTLRIDPAGRTTFMAYDGNGIDLLQISQFRNGGTATDLLGTFTYDTQHSPLTITDASGQVTTLIYNSRGQVTSVTDSKGVVTTYTYDANAYLRTIDGPLAGGAGKLTLTYDTAGRVQTVTDAFNYTLTYAYDNLDRPTVTTYPDGTTQTIAYNLLDIQQTTDRLNRTTSYTYDAVDQLTGFTDPAGMTAAIEHCKCGAISSVTDPLGQKLVYKFDLQGREIAKVYADGSQTTTLYEATTSRPKVITDPRQQTRTYLYNADDTIAEVRSNSPTAAGSVVRFTYDPDYLRTASAQDGAGTTTFSYNPVTDPPELGAARLAAVKNTLGEINYSYDELGRVTTRTVGGQPEIKTYDASGRVEGVFNALGSFSYGYTGTTAQIASESFPNGLTSRFSYLDNLHDGRLGQIKHVRRDGSTLSQWSYGYNLEGEITSWTQQRDSATPRVWTPGYDADSRLTSVALTNPTATASYTYDAVGNRLTETVGGTTTTATYNNLDEIQNLTPPPENDRTYEWDTFNRLAAVNNTTAGTRTEFTYDAFSRRTRITEKSGSTVTSVRQFLWDGRTLAQELGADGNVTKRFFEDGVQIVSGVAAGRYYYTTDHLGSIRELTDESGSMRARYDYDAFGRRTKVSGDLDADIGFTGYYFHAASGLWLAPVRAYDPNVGRWISRDPLEEEGGINPYAFVRNRPLGQRDLSGLDTGNPFQNWLNEQLNQFSLPNTTYGADKLKDIVKDSAAELAEEAAYSAAAKTRKDLADQIKAERKRKCPDKQKLALLRAAFRLLNISVKKLYDSITDLRNKVNGEVVDYNKRMGLYNPSVNLVPYPNGFQSIPTPGT